MATNPSIAKIRYTHDAMIDAIIRDPSISQNDLAAIFGFSPAWVSVVVSSDAFKAKLAERKGELVDPGLAASVNEQLEGLARQSLSNIREALRMNPGKADVALKALELSTRALGYGAKQPTVEINNNYVVALPEKARSGQEWEAKYAAPIDVQPERIANGN